ncbi:hypothetical protein EV644_104479 [Kribbella orskensis]|uniref:LemA protein n=1 Tax=Kribbella orskensis TaxID=2512216 RepID=A0ABY2BNH2_9ACTN|nr:MULTISPECIES: hypothetical protein [Kribbella]TCN42097.1 hypothetical protein EV642_103479 [Kribbella sp. VKM Ac-2500]TCO25975.1 hypothetical protein EV644_104479 [Kribbella orskensis]
MTLPLVLAVVAVLVLLLGAYCSWTAGRLDRLHHRVATARASLETELARRSALVAELASSGVLDPASSLLLLDAAHRARTATPDEREKRESALTRAIGATSTDVEPWAGELGLAVRRVQLARRFHNDIVVSTRELRRRRLVTWFRLAGHAPMPGTIELEDGS